MSNTPQDILVVLVQGISPGTRTEADFFSTSDEAADHYASRLASDPTTRLVALVRTLRLPKEEQKLFLLRVATTLTTRQNREANRQVDRAPLAATVKAASFQAEWARALLAAVEIGSPRDFEPEAVEIARGMVRGAEAEHAVTTGKLAVFDRQGETA